MEKCPENGVNPDMTLNNTSAIIAAMSIRVSLALAKPTAVGNFHYHLENSRKTWQKNVNAKMPQSNSNCFRQIAMIFLTIFDYSEGIYW